MFRCVKPLRFVALACATSAASVAGMAVSHAQQRQAPMFYDARRLPDMEVERRNQEVLQEQRRASEERRLETEANSRRLADEAKAQEARIAAESAAKKKADDARVAALETQRKADEDKRLAAEAEAKKKADEAARVAALETQRKADEDKRLAAEAEAKKKADEAARVAALETQRKADEDKRLAAEAEAKKKADEAARVAALETQRKADEDKRLAAEAEAKKKADEATRLAALETQRKADEDKRLAAEAEAKKKADEAARVAALETQRKADEAARAAALAAQTRAAPAQQTVALIPQVVPAQQVAAGAPCEATKAQISYLAGGVMRAVIASPCRKGQAVSVSYGGTKTVRKIDANGNAKFDVDLFLGNSQPVALSYLGGHTETVQPAAGDLAEVFKIALIWDAPVNLDLHAFENGSLPGKSGHLWAGSTGTPKAAKAQLTDNGRGGGFISLSDDGAHEGSKVEVYTFFRSAEQPTGVVAMSLDYASRGDTPSGEYCGTGAQASVTYETVTWSPKGTTARERGAIAGAACGVPLSSRLIRDAVPDLQFGQ